MFDLRWSKGLIIALVLLGWSTLSLAQRNNPYYDNKKIHFGFHVGYNSSTLHMGINSPRYLFNDTLEYIEPSYGPGFQLGVIGDLRMNEYMTLRFTPTLMFSQRNIQYYFENPLYNIRRAIQVANVDLPLAIKWRSERINNYRIYLITGVKHSIDMASQERVVEDVERVKLRRHDFSYEIGIGADIYLPFFKFSPEIRFAQGLRNIVVPETHVYTSPLEHLRARTIIISFNFE
ncbi:MAG: porin family protein [Bacteroidia bacterium]